MTVAARSTSSRPTGSAIPRSYCQLRAPHVSLVVGRVAALIGAAWIAFGVTTAGGASGLSPTESLVVATGKAPCGSAVRNGRLWVGVYDTGKVLQIDRGGRVTKRFTVRRWACRVAVGRDAIWVTRDQAGELVRIARSGRLLRTRVGAGAFDVLVAAGSVWASSYDTGTVARLDPLNGKLRSVSRVGPNPAGVAWCGGRVWVGHGRQATWLSAIAPATMRVERVDVGAETPSWPSCIHGELWVTTSDSVLRLDSHTGAVLARAHPGGTPADITAGPDALVWVTDKERSLVFRVNPKGNAVVDSFPAGPGAFSLARLGNSVWVTSFAGADVRRYDP